MEPNPKETLPSFLSRLAAANGLDVVSFSKDMGFFFKRVLNFEEAALKRLAEVAGTSAEVLDELISWTRRPSGDIRTQFRGELVPSRALRSPLVRGCPSCLLDDLKSGQDRPLTALTCCGDWQLKDTKDCVEHNAPFIPLWEEKTPSRRWDLQARFSDLLGSSTLTQTKPFCSHVWEYDHWLHQRLLMGNDDTWFQSHTIFAASRLCMHIGQQIIIHDIAEPFGSPGEERPEAIGFNALREGPSRLPAVLNTLVAAASGAGGGPKKAFGTLYPMLNRDYADAEEFEEFRCVYAVVHPRQLASCAGGYCPRAGYLRTNAPFGRQCSAGNRRLGKAAGQGFDRERGIIAL
ncbi:TniQ family protein [Epibacterium ulvae]|uniref:TniQ family protein n=1 Tax=Epibacterium ulvae TaxID=1156985 RepID=UPI001E368519|nr:TniQ family protein [Epibacterium ulvae]